MGTRNGGAVLGLPVGEIAPGYRADLVGIRLDDLSLQPRGPIEKHLVYALDPRAIAWVVVAGRPVVEHGTLLTVPEQEILARVARPMSSRCVFTGQATPRSWRPEAGS